jgi:aminobenzoyl-glutamate utilization protein B
MGPALAWTAAAPARSCWRERAGLTRRRRETTPASARRSSTCAEKEGFQVKRGVGGQPTAFVATAGSGSPTLAYLVEYDALPGLSQAAGVPKRQPLVEGGAGHACGHNLLGTASAAAAVAANRERQSRNLAGTIQVFGTPAEEVLYGKTFMVRDGAFARTDVALTWHPDEQNRVVNRTRLAAAAVEVDFFGKSAHASSSPWLGRKRSTRSSSSITRWRSCASTSAPRRASTGS